MARDKHGIALPNLEDYNVAYSNPSAFDGGTADARGEDGGASDPKTLFTVTGDVIVRIFGVCTTLLAGATATLEVGVTGNTAVLIAQTTATDIDANEIWLGASPSAVGVDALSDVPGPFVIVNGLDIIETVATADITAGQIYYICLWRPLSEDGNVVGVSEA